MIRAILLALAVLTVPAGAIEFETSKFRRAGGYEPAMVRAWENGRTAAKASAFFVANRQNRLLVMTAGHVVGRSPVFTWRGKRAVSARRVLKEKDIAVYEVSFGSGVRYESVGKFHLSGRAPKMGETLAVVGYPRGFSGALMVSRNCSLLNKKRMLHPTYFTCQDLDRWCRYAEKAEKSRSTCRADAIDVKKGRARQCSLPLEERATRPERHRQSTHAMNCAVRLGSSGGPVVLGDKRMSRSVVGMPSAVFARVRGPYPDDLGVGVAVFSQGFKAKARRLGIEVR